jgi:hypothetical protein
MPWLLLLVFVAALMTGQVTTPVNPDLSWEQFK